MCPNEKQKSQKKIPLAFGVAGAEQISNFIEHYYLLVNLHDSLKSMVCFRI